MDRLAQDVHIDNQAPDYLVDAAETCISDTEKHIGQSREQTCLPVTASHARTVLSGLADMMCCPSAVQLRSRTALR